jgi:uncharacterized protein
MENLFLKTIERGRGWLDQREKSVVEDWLHLAVQPAQIAGAVLMLIGLIGAVLPMVPGPLLIWLGAFLWAWEDGFQVVGWPTLVILGLLALLAWGLDLFLSLAMSRKAGASWWSLLGAIVGGFVGGIFLSQIPVIGTIFGALIGALLGMWGVEYYLRQDEQSATAVVWAYVKGVFVTTFFEVVISLGMVAYFAWQVFL